MRTRRDPRSERDARLVPGTARRRFTLTAPPCPPPGRPRRDPRARRIEAVMWAPLRPRIDWYAGRSAQAGTAARQDISPAATPAIRIIAESAFLVLAVADQPGGALSEHDRQTIAAARHIAEAGSGAVVVLAIGLADGLAEAGADRVMALPAGLAGNDHPEFRAAAIAAAIVKLKPRHILFAESAEGGADLARRIAAVSGERLFSGVESIDAERVSRRAQGGRMEMVAALPRLMSVAENAFLPHDGPPHEARNIAAPAFSVRSSTSRATRLPVDSDRIPLAEAEFILSAGNGVTDWQSFAELGRVLGATRGGSRVVCDEGHLPRDRQVGASGSVVTARCYLAFGISGAPQHLQGVTEVKHVVAVNTDLHAEMIKRADLAIIADAQEIMPALIRHAKARSGKVATGFPPDAAGGFHPERSRSRERRDD